MDIVGFLLTVVEKAVSPVIRWWKHPEFVVERIEHQGYNMINEQRRTLNLAIVLRNAGRGAADNWRAEVQGAGLGLLDPRNPGNARIYQADGHHVVEWQSAEPVPSTHTRTIACTVNLGNNVEVALTVSAPHMKPLRRRIVVDWRGREPVFSVA